MSMRSHPPRTPRRALSPTRAPHLPASCLRPRRDRTTVEATGGGEAVGATNCNTRRTITPAGTVTRRVTSRVTSTATISTAFSTGSTMGREARRGCSQRRSIGRTHSSGERGEGTAMAGRGGGECLGRARPCPMQWSRFRFAYGGARWKKSCTWRVCPETCPRPTRRRSPAMRGVATTTTNTPRRPPPRKGNNRRVGARFRRGILHRRTRRRSSLRPPPHRARSL